VSVPDLVFQTSLGNLGYEHVEVPAPVFDDDTLRAETTILDSRESESRSDRGMVWFEPRG
jgi:acyl dehydratase